MSKRNVTINTIILTLVGIILCTVDKATSYFSTPPSIRRCPIKSDYIETTTTINFGTIAIPLKLQISDLPYEDDSGLSYAERIRPFRRDVFDSNEWVRARSTPRFSTNLYGVFQSGVVRQLLTVQEAIFILCVATFICLYNALLVHGYDDFAGIHHDPLGEGFYEISLPSMIFTLTSAPLSILLLFKTDSSFERWDTARKNWGAIINSSRTIMREGSVWIREADISQEEKVNAILRLAGAVWCCPRSMARHVLSFAEDEAAYAAECRSILRLELAEDLIAARHRPARALYELSCAINELPISVWRRIEIDRAANELCNAMGSNERIFASPVPLLYTRFTSRFLEIWLLFLPMTLYGAFSECWNHWVMIPATMVLTFFLTGIQELGLQLEEPFGILPMHNISHRIGLSANEHVNWMKNDVERRGSLS